MDEQKDKGTKVTTNYYYSELSKPVLHSYELCVFIRETVGVNFFLSF